MEFTVIGSVVNNAHLYSDLARPNEILISDAVGAAMGGTVRVRELEERPDRPMDQRILKVVG